MDTNEDLGFEAQSYETSKSLCQPGSEGFGDRGGGHIGDHQKGLSATGTKVASRQERSWAEGKHVEAKRETFWRCQDVLFWGNLHIFERIIHICQREERINRSI